MPKLLTPINFGSLELLHRVVVLASTWPERRVAVGNARHGLSGGMVMQVFLPYPDAAELSETRYSRMMAGYRQNNDAMRAKRGSTVAQMRLDRLSLANNEAETGAWLVNWRGRATLARKAGFDGIELNAAWPAAQAPSGTLLDAVQVVIDVWGADRVGVQLAPFAWMTGPDDDHSVLTYKDLLATLKDLEIAFVHIAGAVTPDRGDLSDTLLGRCLRKAFPGILIASGAYTPRGAILAVENRWADAIGFALTASSGEGLLRDIDTAAQEHRATSASMLGDSAT